MTVGTVEVESLADFDTGSGAGRRLNGWFVAVARPDRP